MLKSYGMNTDTRLLTGDNSETYCIPVKDGERTSWSFTALPKLHTCSLYQNNCEFDHYKFVER